MFEEYAREIKSPPEFNFNHDNDDEVLDDMFELGISPIRGLGDYANLGDQETPTMTRNERRAYCAMNQKLFAELYMQDAVVEFQEPEFPENLGEIIRANALKQKLNFWQPKIDQFIIEIRTMLQSESEITWEYYGKIIQAIDAAQKRADECGYAIDVEERLMKVLEYHYNNRKRLDKIKAEAERRAWYLGTLQRDKEVYVKTTKEVA